MRALLIALFMIMPVVAWGQVFKGIPPLYQGDDMPTCNADREGWRVRVNADDSTNCETVGSTVHMCECIGTNWTDVDLGDLPSGSIDTVEIENSTIGSTDLSSDIIQLPQYRTQPITVSFCGNGANGSTEWFIGPTGSNALSSDGADWSVGSAACDGNDNGSVGTADAQIPGLEEMNYKLKWLHCTVEDVLSGDTATFAVTDDGSVIDIACTTGTLDGSGTDTCDDSNVQGLVIAGGSEVGIRTIMSGTDDFSAADVYCTAGGTILNDN